MDVAKIKKVYVVYKTHLDIGFTDMGKNVLNRYINEHIPHSVSLAKKLNTKDKKQFIWTLGSYLIDYNLKYGTEEQKKELIRAIENGDICWHGIACTTHTELMDMDLFRYSLEIGKKLDERFSKKTIAAKMTDVPGHTIAIVDALADYGIRFLHIGVNASSMVPQIPQTFLWKHGDKEVVVQYSAQYGAPRYVEGTDAVLEFAHTSDNLGPQSEKEIQEEFARLQTLYPNASIEAATLDDYAAYLLKEKELLPVVEEEIGDTWIHGIASDPWKVGRYEELLRLKTKWKQEGIFTEETQGYDEFMTNLMLIAEHTWGLDYKKYLLDFKHWSKEEFREARRKDATTMELLTNRNAQMVDVLNIDFQRYRGGVSDGSYSYYESSHQEQRDYLKKAVSGLPENLKKEAEDALRTMTPVYLTWEREPLQIGQDLELAGWKVRIGGDGALIQLEKDGKDWAKDGKLGKLSYETFNALDCVQNYYRYNRAFYETECWSEGDFSKPGLEFVEDLEHRKYDFYTQAIQRDGKRLLITLIGEQSACEKYGCPRKAQICYDFRQEEIRCSLAWFEKDANRMPEALWFEFQIQTENPSRWQMGKMGTWISPLDVVRGGNRIHHCVPEVRYSGSDGKALIRSIHAPLMSLSGANLYGDYLDMPDLKKGFSYNLFNNKWGTNFSMWCEDECRFDFALQFEAYKNM